MNRSIGANRYKSVKKVADNIRIFRQLRHLTHQQMAKELSMSRNNFAGIESGNMPIPMATVRKISAVLGICPEALMHVDPDKINPEPGGEIPSVVQDILPEVTFAQRVSKIEAKLEELYTLVVHLVQVVDVVQHVHSPQHKPVHEAVLQ